MTTNLPPEAVNLRVHPDGTRARPVCMYCTRTTRAYLPLDCTGRLAVGVLPHGWRVAYYPADHVHIDGSTSDLFACSRCNTLMAAGAALMMRAPRR